ncbi:MAG: DUF6629 family protein [Thiolinea sp.]
MAIGFLFFAYFLWPFFVPLAALLVEQNSGRKKLFLFFSILGFLFGASLFVPLLVYPDWLSVELMKGSIFYQPALLYDGVLSRSVIRVAYAIIVAVPLLFSSVKSVKIFGIMIVVSVIGTVALFNYAFVSVWCFFAALLSIYNVYIIRSESNRVS